MKEINVHNPDQDEEMWRVSILEELLDVRAKNFEFSGFEKEELEELLHVKCPYV